MAAGMTIAGTSGREHGRESKRSFPKRKRRTTRATLEHRAAPSCFRAIFVFQLTHCLMGELVLQTKLQTNNAAQDGIGDHKATSQPYDAHPMFSNLQFRLTPIGIDKTDRSGT
jgi:hypothetical protein